MVLSIHQNVAISEGENVTIYIFICQEIEEIEGKEMWNYNITQVVGIAYCNKATWLYCNCDL